MKHQKWTVLLVGGDETSVRQYSVSAGAVRFFTVAGVLGTIGLLTLASMAAFGGALRLRAAHLDRENAMLVEELDGLRSRVGELDGTLVTLSEQDSRYRVLAGLEPIDPEVLQVGVGGPGSTGPSDHPLWAVDSIAGNEAFAIGYDLNALERRAELLAGSLLEASDSLRAHHDLLESTPSILPASGLLSSSFSRARMHPVHHQLLPHKGIDIGATKGTPIMAAAQGRVVKATRSASLGLMVEIDHGYGFVTRYGHASELLVKRGQRVERGDVIALVGSTGIATSAHLHYEVWVGGKAVNPMNYVLNEIP